jgi:phenylpyruvate tautomerase
MPYLTITSNQILDTGSEQLGMLSKIVAEGLNKPESYVMIAVQHNPNMLFAGKREPLAFCELKSLGLQESQTTGLSQSICSCLNRLYGIHPSRVYIEFSAPARAMWGWNNKTF